MDSMKNVKTVIGTFVFLLIVWGCKNDSDYIIGNNPNEFAVFPVAIPVSADGGTYELTVTGNESWTARLTDSNSSVSEWCTLSETSGSGQKVITVAVKPSNSFVKNRSILIEVSAGSKMLKSRVLQGTMVLGEDEVLINGLVWSTKNIGAPGTFADSPDATGMFYQFNRKTGYPSGPQGDPAPANWPSEYTNDNTNWLPENDPSPEGWRIPTTAEMVALWEIGATWRTAAQTGFSVAGMIVGIPEVVAVTANKDNLKQLGGLFLPISGWRDENGVIDRMWLCAVRSSTQLSATHGGMTLGVTGYLDLWGWGDGQKPRAGMIRPVKNIAIEN